MLRYLRLREIGIGAERAEVQESSMSEFSSEISSDLKLESFQIEIEARETSAWASSNWDDGDATSAYWLGVNIS